MKSWVTSVTRGTGLLACTALLGAAAPMPAMQQGNVTDIAALSQTQVVIEIIVEANVDSVNVHQIAECVLQNAGQSEIASLAQAALNGINQTHVDCVVDLAYQPRTMACVRAHAEI